MSKTNNQAAIVGIGQTEFSKDSGRSEQQLAAEAVIAACKDAGINPEEIDGCITYTIDNSDEVDLLRSVGCKEINYTVRLPQGGAANAATLYHAKNAVEAGVCDVVVIWRAMNERSQYRFGQPTVSISPDANGSTFIDGGANIGFFSLIASKIVSPTGSVIAFEPTPITFNYLKKNININKINNIIVSDRGLSSTEELLPFLLRNNNPEANSIISKEDESSQNENQIIKISTTTIDKFCSENNIKKIDLIKLDIEGQELEAIKGAREILSINQNIKIIFELNIAFRKNGIEFAKEIFTELNRLNFFNFVTLLNPRISIKNLDNPKDLELIKKITNRHNVNILAYR